MSKPHLAELEFSSDPDEEGTVLLLNAFDKAVLAHSGQTRKESGEPYIIHPIRVAKILATGGFCDVYLQCAALLHDVLEDTKESIDEFPQTVRELVSLVTRKKGESKDEAIEKLAGRALLLKMADRLDNFSGDGEFTRKYRKREHSRTIRLLELAEAGGFKMTDLFLMLTRKTYESS